MAFGYFSNITGPLFPIPFAADTLDHTGINSPLEFGEVERRLIRRSRRAAAVTAFVIVRRNGADENLFRFIFVQFNLIDGSIETVIMRP